jgi:hypothetical protein
MKILFSGVGWRLLLPPQLRMKPSKLQTRRREGRSRVVFPKQHGLGLIKFIGELFKLQMLTERIMHECAKKLLGNVDNPRITLQAPQYILLPCKLLI